MLALSDPCLETATISVLSFAEILSPYFSFPEKYIRLGICWRSGEFFSSSVENNSEQSDFLVNHFLEINPFVCSVPCFYCWLGINLFSLNRALFAQFCLYNCSWREKGMVNMKK